MSLPGPLARQVRFETGNVLPLLHEIRHALERLLHSGEESVIDLRSMPLAPGEEERIDALLGRGEVYAELDAIGPSTVIETVFPGVWMVCHLNAEGEQVGKFIEITRMPEILTAQTRDVEAGRDRLTEQLDRLNGADETAAG